LEGGSGARKKEKGEGGAPLSFYSGEFYSGEQGEWEKAGGGLWGEDGDREELCAYNKDELSVVVS